MPGRYERRFFDSNGDALEGATIYIENQDTTTQYSLSESATRAPGTYFADNVPHGFYKINVNGSQITQNIWFGDIKVTNLINQVDSDDDNLVETAGIEDGAITQAKIATDAVGSTQLAAGAVDSTAIQNDAVTGSKIADDAIANNHIGNGAVDNAELATDAISQGKIQAGAITEEKIQSGAVTNIKLAGNAVTASKLADNAVQNAKINNSAVTTAKLADNAVTNDKIAAAAVNQESIASLSVGLGELIDDAVQEAKIQNNAVTNSKIAANAVTTSKIQNASVSTDKIVDLNVTSDKIADNAIVKGKIANGAVDGNQLAALAVSQDKIADGAVGTSQLEDNAVTSAKIPTGAIGSSEIDDDAVTVLKIANDAVTTAKVLDAAITPAKLAADAVNTAAVADAAIIQAHLSQALQDWITANAGTGAAITNNPDDVTIETTAGSQLQLKDLGITSAKMAQVLQDEIGSRAAVFVAAADTVAVHKDHADHICDGTDDHDTIAAAVDDNKNVILLPGTYNIDFDSRLACIVIENKSNFGITLMPGAILKKINSADGFAIKYYQCSDAFFRGGEVDGNKGNSALKGGISINNSDRIAVVGVHVHDCETHAVGVYASRDVQVERVIAKNFDGAHCYDIDTDSIDHNGTISERVVIAHCYSENPGLDNLKFENCRRCYAHDNIFVSSVTQSGFVIENNDSSPSGITLEDIHIHHNYFIDARDSLVNGGRSGHVTIDCNYFINTQVKFGNNGGDVDFLNNVMIGRDVNTTLQINSTMTDKATLRIIGNRIKGPDTGTESKLVSIATPAGGARTIFAHNSLWNFRNKGIEVGANAEPVSLWFNDFKSAGESNSWTGNLIAIELLNSGNHVIGNRCELNKIGIRCNGASAGDHQISLNHIIGDSNATAGITHVSNPNDLHIVNNFVTGFSSNKIVTGTGTGHVVRDNKGYVTRASGQVTINSGETSEDVTPGVDFDVDTESIKKVHLTMASAAGTAGQPYPTVVSTTQFRINVADPGQTININWAIEY